MGNQNQELDEDITLLIEDAETSLIALKGLGLKEEIEELLGKVFPEPELPKATREQASEAFELGKAEYKAGETYSEWACQSEELQTHYKAGWLSEAHECAVLKDVIDDLFENAADHQYWLEAATLILGTEAEHTKLKERRVHFNKVTKNLESHLRILRKITGQEEITVTTETLEPKEGLTEEANGGAGSVASYNDPVAAG